MNFKEWKEWKEAQTKPTCDYIGCIRAPALVLPKQHIFFCAEHAAEKDGYIGLERMYGEPAILYSLWSTPKAIR